MIENAFKKGPAFIAYLTAGDGGLDYSLEAALALEQGGVDLLEVGIPFSDPMADGPTIQKAMARSLAAGMTPLQVLPFIERLRQHSSIPVVLFTYYSPIYQLGREFFAQAKQAGANGILIVDLPPEEMDEPLPHLEQVLLVSASTPKERIEKIAGRSQGFIYYVIQKGTTGARSVLPEDLPLQIQNIKKRAKLPVVAGFGIASRENAERTLNAGTDGFVVGSFFVDAMGKKVSPEALKQLAESIDPRIKV